MSQGDDDPVNAGSLYGYSAPVWLQDLYLGMAGYQEDLKFKGDNSSCTGNDEKNFQENRKNDSNFTNISQKSSLNECLSLPTCLLKCMDPTTASQ